MNTIYPVILSGGSGSRLWPVSREGYPKPFMKLNDGQSLLEKTYRRASRIQGVHKLNDKAQLLTVTNRNYFFMSRDELEKTDASGTFLLEPFARNTAGAIALAAHYVHDFFGPDALMLVLAADHLIMDEVAFSKSVELATELASRPNNFLVTFGVVPQGPETGYGYIEAGEKIIGGYKAKAFIEKPDSKTAKKFLTKGNYFWNSGMFCFSAGQFLQEIALLSSDLSSSAEVCWQAMKPKNAQNSEMLEISESLFRDVPNISVDYAVMEKSKHVAVIPGDFGWSDIGSWAAMQELVQPDAENNRSAGETIFVKTQNTFVKSEGRLVATVGVNNLMIIDTKDALLVIDPAYVQDVKEVVNLLKQKNHDAYKVHQTVSRPWGTYTVLEDMYGFKVKRIEIKPGGCLSLQTHQHRNEHWVVVRGQALITNGDEIKSLLKNQSTYIPANQKHRLENPSDELLVIIEVQCGDYLGEDDIIRYDDNYGRSKNSHNKTNS